MSSRPETTSATAPREEGDGAARGGPRATAFTVFLAAVGPMLTVPALRHLLQDRHGVSPAGVHAFVAAGMLGACLGAPLLASRADARAARGPGAALRLAGALAALDALVALISSSTASTTLLFLLRPLHGIASMALLSILFAEVRCSSKRVVAHAGGAMVIALALGPALGGMLTHLRPEAPFLAHALVSSLVALLLADRREELAGAGAPAASGPATESSPLTAPLAPPPPALAMIRTFLAPLLTVASQRFLVGGLVGTFAVQARSVHGLSDARVGASFSLVLVVFAAGVFALGRLRAPRELAGIVPLGAALAGLTLGTLGLLPRAWLPAGLALGGLGLAMVYAPSLGLVASASHPARRATAMSLLHAAGAVGMTLGPVLAGLVDLALDAHTSLAAPMRAAAFMALAGALHLLVALSATLLAGARAPARAAPAPPSSSSTEFPLAKTP